MDFCLTEFKLRVLFLMGTFVSMFTISENFATNTFDCRVLYMSQILSFNNEVEQMSFCYHTVNPEVREVKSRYQPGQRARPIRWTGCWVGPRAFLNVEPYGAGIIF
jgi:hypothetical protein